MSDLTVRAAHKNDRAVFWDWYQEPLRQILFPRDRQVTRDACCRWFDEMMLSERNVLFIGLVDIIRIGVARFEEGDPGMFSASLFVKPIYTRQGLLPKLLNASLKALRSERVVNIVSLEIPLLNPASRAIFEREGYTFDIAENGNLRWEGRD